MFYEFRQNNSGGHFDLIKDTGITATVLIEADSPDHANTIMGELIDDDWCGGQGGYCKCCGERWYKLWSDEKGIEDINKYIEDSQKSQWNIKWVESGYNTCVHYLSWEKVWY